MSSLKDLGISCLFLCLLRCCWSFCDLSTIIFCWKPNILLFVSLISFFFHFISFSSLSFFFFLLKSTTLSFTWHPFSWSATFRCFYFPSFLPLFFLSLFLCSLLKCFCLFVSFFLSIFVVVFCLFLFSSRKAMNLWLSLSTGHYSRRGWRTCQSSLALVLSRTLAETT